MGGYMAAGQYQSQQQASGDQHQEAMQQLAKGKLEIAQTQQLLDAQAAAMMELKGRSHSGAGGAPGTQGGVGGIAGQSYNAADLAFAAGETYMKHGLIQQGSEFMEKGAKLAESGSALEIHQAAQQAKMWGHVGSVLDTIHENSPTAAADWDKARMTFPLMFPDEAKHPEVQKFLSQPYDPQTVDLLKRASMTAQQQAELQKTKAEAKKDEAMAKFEAAGVPLRQAEAKEHSARAAAIGKAGGKPPPAAEVNNAKSLIQADYPDADPKGYQLYATEVAERAKGLMASGQTRDEAFQQAYSELNDSGKLKNLPAKASVQKENAAGKAQAEARQGSVQDIDAIIALLDQGEATVGIGRKFKNVGEWLASVGSGDDDVESPQASFDGKLGVLISRLPAALAKKGKLAADERQIVRDISDLRKPFTTPSTAKATLMAVRERLMGEDGSVIKGKGDKTTAPVTISSDAEFNKLPSGAMFIGPDGKTRRKP